jgi:ureidoglycolate dehydrogenase (NAD+)
MTATHIPCERINAWAIDCLEASGVPHDDAEIVATSLVQTSLWGIDSHGILRLTHYLTRIAAGSVKPKAEVLVRQTGPCTAQMAGDDGLGIVHCVRAMELAVRMAGASGAGIVGVGGSSHCGAVGLYTRQAAAAHLIGIAFTHADSMVVPHGGNQKYFGTNPISIAFPRSGGAPVCLDMATSQVAWNKVMNARTENTALQPGLTVDAEGKPTTDPHQAQALIPLGGETYGYKGYGLALMIDLLCGALNGMAFGPNLTAMYADLDKPRRIGHLLIAIDPKRFAGAATLEAMVRTLTDDLKSRGDILFAGEPEYRSEAERRTTGIPIAPAALADMNHWSARLGVAPLSAPLSKAAAA